MSLTFRPIQPEDMDFLYQVYASTRQDEMALTGWDAAAIDTFLQSQFQAQHTYYQQHYRQTCFQVVLLDDHPIGRLYLAYWADEIRIVDIALLPDYRHHGLGTAMLHDIFEEARQLKVAVRIHVEVFNPALAWYTRLGFRKVEDRGVYYFMEWLP
ncbi:MAG: GNAT family N-acetyltransferase [Anaerolineae bacterium]|nr:GNAT family N-acetyltransferase [Anaerolineae bacterium]